MSDAKPIVEIGELTPEVFRARTGIDICDETGGDAIMAIVSPKELHAIRRVYVMRQEYLEALLRSIPLTGNRSEMAYASRRIHLQFLDPRGLRTGQRYAYRPNYVSIIEDLPNLLQGFTSADGILQSMCAIIVGENTAGQPVAAHYLPPIAEARGSEIVQMDGTHRAFLARSIGKPVYTIVIEDVETPYPCRTMPFSTIQVLEKKPENITQRYWDLDTSLFRDMKYVGIDG
jgi:hypothetical protein